MASQNSSWTRDSRTKKLLMFSCGFLWNEKYCAQIAAAILPNQGRRSKLLEVELRSSRLIEGHAIPAHGQQPGRSSELAKEP